MTSWGIVNSLGVVDDYCVCLVSSKAESSGFACPMWASWKEEGILCNIPLKSTLSLERYVV